MPVRLYDLYPRRASILGKEDTRAPVAGYPSTNATGGLDDDLFECDGDKQGFFVLLDDVELEGIVVYPAILSAKPGQLPAGAKILVNVHVDEEYTKRRGQASESGVAEKQAAIVPFTGIVKICIISIISPRFLTTGAWCVLFSTVMLCPPCPTMKANRGGSGSRCFHGNYSSKKNGY